jgi:hypothetical protein
MGGSYHQDRCNIPAQLQRVEAPFSTGHVPLISTHASIGRRAGAVFLGWWLRSGEAQDVRLSESGLVSAGPNGIIDGIGTFTGVIPLGRRQLPVGRRSVRTDDPHPQS